MGDDFDRDPTLVNIFLKLQAIVSDLLKPSPAREQEFSHKRNYGSGLGQGLI